MNYARKGMFNRVIALALSVLMIATILPMDVFAIEENKNAVTINLGEESFVANEEKEFSVTTTASDDEGTLVRGYFEFADLPEGTTVELKYYEPQDGNWYPLTGAFGPETGFPLTDGATSTFSAKFSTPGSYNVTVSIKAVGDGSELCSTTETVVVDRKASVLSTNVGETTFVSGEATEFTFSTTPNDDAGKMVRGYFEFTNLPEGTTAKLEYYEPQDGNWYELTGAFGPETGFPMIEGESKFRATFNKAGTYEVTVSMKTVADDTVLCSTKANVVVNKKASALSSDIDEKEFAVGEAMEFTFSTTPNDDAGEMVRGYFEFSDPTAIEKLEYYEPQDGNWYELTGAFGPETGFPMITGTSKFRATFNKAGAYEVTVSMKTVADDTVLCFIKKNVTVVQKVTVGVSKNEGGTVTLNGTNSDELSNGLRVTVGTNVAINLQAESGYQISSLNLGGVLIANASGETEFAVSNMIVNRDVQIEVTFVKVWTVSVSQNEGGTVTLNGTDSSNLGNGLVVNTGSNVSVKVQAKEGYQISSLNLGGVLIANASGETEFTVANMIVGRDVNVEVTFVKVWTVTVSCEGNGKVYIDNPNNVAGEVSAVVVQGNAVKVGAIPETGYRVLTVAINTDDVETFTANDQKYATTINDIKGDYKVEITFAPNVYNINSEVNDEKYGTVVANPKDVEHGNASTITVTPEEGYSVTGIAIKGASEEAYTSITGNIDEYITDYTVATDCSGVITFNVIGIKEHKDVKVTFAATTSSNVSFEDLFEDAIREDSLTYVYAKDETVEFKTPADSEGLKYEGIVLYDKSGNEILYGAIAGEGRTKTIDNVKKLDSTEVVEIGKIELIYQDNAAGEMAIMRHTVSTLDNPITLVFDDTKAKITLLPEEPKNNGIYGFDYKDKTVKVDVKVEDLSFDTVNYPNAYSGIESITYEIVKDGTITTQSDTLYPYEDAVAGGILQTWDSSVDATDDKLSIEVDTKLNNSSNVVVIVTAKDKAGNEQSEEVKLDIDITAPTIDISFDEEADKAYKASWQKGDENRGYFQGKRVATVTITERGNHFNEDKALEGIRLGIEAKDANDNSVEAAYTISDWTHNNSEPYADTDTHSVTITFGPEDEDGKTKDANFTWSVSYTDEADNENVGQTESGKTPRTFTVDTTPPTGTVIATTGSGNPKDWSELLKKIDFYHWANDKMSIARTCSDITSEVKSVEYYKVTIPSSEGSVNAWTERELDTLSSEKTPLDERIKWEEFPSDGLIYEKDEQFYLYLKITDYADNYTYISTNGLVVDKEKPETDDLVAPSVNIEPKVEPINGIYKGDVWVDISVEDPVIDGTYAGLKNVYYVVESLGVETVNCDEGNLYFFDPNAKENIEPISNKLERTYSKSIKIEAAENNSNDVVVRVYAVDNAGNKAEVKELSLKIDTQKPIVAVTYNNNNVDSGCFYNAPRTATITITERNFNPNDVYATVNGQKVVWAAENWTYKKAEDRLYVDQNGKQLTPNGDLDTWTTTLEFSGDGSYDFDIGSEGKNESGNTIMVPFVDMAGWSAEAIVESFFIIDKTRPEVTVTYDNNNSLNEKYYKDTRTATITITEPNLTPYTDSDRIQIIMTAEDDGTVIANPKVSSWQTSGAVHKATIEYVADGHYTFDIVVRDKAGNYANDFYPKEFYIDRTAPSLEITGVANNSANAGNVIPVITYSDTNWDPAQVSITLTGANRGGVALDGAYTDIHNGRVFTFRNFAKVQSVDDIYTLTATLTDKAGNTTTETINFSVNRFGSTYAMSEETKALNGTYVQEPIDVVVTETNADALDNVKITLFKNNQTLDLVEGEDYKITLKGGNGQWYQYTYTVLKKNFAEDGVYRLTFHSEDAAGNIAENTLDTKEMEIGFGVDATKPDIVIANIADGVTYALENITVNMSINDNLLLKSIKVYLDNVEVKQWNAEEITAVYAENGEFTFDIPGDSKSAHEVKVVSVDAAGNEAVETISGFYVTTDILVRYVNNKPLFYGSISGTCLLAGLMIFLIVFLRKRKEDEE